ncbi:MAG: hypothetical protein WCK85_08270 [Chlorobium sp.]
MTHKIFITDVAELVAGLVSPAVCGWRQCHKLNPLKCFGGKQLTCPFGEVDWQRRVVAFLLPLKSLGWFDLFCSIINQGS